MHDLYQDFFNGKSFFIGRSFTGKEVMNDYNFFSICIVSLKK